MKKITKNRGFSLIEVLIALLVLALGILGISKLQGTLIRNSSDANQRSVATSLAQMKIDDLRSYVLMNRTDVDGDGKIEITADDDWQAGLTTTQQSFAYIATNQGGAAYSTPDNVGDFNRSQLVNGKITFQNYEFNLSWEVADYYYDDDDADPATPEVASTTPSGDIDFKSVIVRVTWNDETDTQQQIALSTVIDAYAPAMTSLSDNSNTGGTPPQASYTPEAAPDVIDIGVNTGEGKFRQTSKPLPDAVKTGADANTLVSFEVVTYHENPDVTDEFIADINEEFVTVDCECQFTGNGPALPPAHVVWDTASNTRLDYVGPEISKPTAVQVNNANAVDEICTTCCQDHHDSDDSPVKYVPKTSGGDHKHYQTDGITEAIQANNDIYIESCRFKRVDGVLRVFQDWKLYNITTMNRENLADGEALQTLYSTYVGNFVLEHLGVAVTPSKPDADTDILTTVGAAHQLESRGVYIDDVYDSDGNESAAYASYVLASSPVNEDRLEKTPFSEVNLSLLSRWDSDSVTEVTVTNEAVATIADPANDYYGTYSRGWIDALAETAGVPVTANIADSNNGITQVVNTLNNDIFDPINVAVDAAAGNFDITIDYSFSFPNGDSSVDSTEVTSTGDALTCSTPAGNKVICNASAPWAGDITVTVKVNGASKCAGAVTYSATNISTDPAVSLAGSCI